MGSKIRSIRRVGHLLGAVLSAFIISAIPATQVFAQSGVPIPANEVLSGPASGAAAEPLYRLLVADDIPAIINPNGVNFDEQATVPGGAPAAGTGTVWVRSDTPNVLMFTDDVGTDFVISTTIIELFKNSVNNALFRDNLVGPTVSGDLGIDALDIQSVRDVAADFNQGDDSVLVGGASSIAILGAPTEESTIVVGFNNNATTPNAGVGNVIFGKDWTTTSSGNTLIGNGTTLNANASNVIAITCASASSIGFSQDVVLIGCNVTSAGNDGIAIGTGATQTANDAHAIGRGTTASASGAQAIGRSATAAHVNAIALGKSASTTTANQIMLGTSAEFVQIPGTAASTTPTTGSLIVTGGTGLTGQLTMADDLVILNNGTVDPGAGVGVFSETAIRVRDDFSALTGMFMQNVNAGTMADMRFIIYENGTPGTDAGYTAFNMPSTGNTAGPILGLPRATSTFHFYTPSVGGTDRNMGIGLLGPTGNLVLGTNNLTRLSIDGATGNFDSSVDLMGASRLFTWANTNTAASSGAKVLIQAAAGTAGDPQISFDSQGSTGEFSMGIDQTDSKFHISVSDTLGSTDAIIVDSSGNVEIPLKLTVGGLIDPTGLVLDEQSAIPFATTAGKGLLWVKDDSPSVLFSNDDTGNTSALTHIAPSETGVYTWNSPGSAVASATQVTIQAGTGRIVNFYTNVQSPVITNVSWSLQTITVPSLATEDTQFLFADSAGTLTFQTTAPTAAQKRANIYLSSIIVNTNTSTVLEAFAVPDVVGSTSQLVLDTFGFSGAKVSIPDVTFNASLTFAVAANGILFPGVNWITSKSTPNEVTHAAEDPVTFDYISSDGIEDPAETLVDPDTFDPGGLGTLVTVGNNKATNQFLFQDIKGNYYLQYGQVEYNSLTDAFTSVDEEARILVVAEFIQVLGTLIAVFSLDKGTTNLDTQALLTQPTTGGSIGGGGSGNVNGSGTVDTVPLWTAGDTIGDSIITQPTTTQIIVGDDTSLRSSVQGLTVTGTITTFMEGISASDSAGTRAVALVVKSRGTLAAPTAVMTSDQLGSYIFGGYDGTNTENGVALTALVDGAVALGSIPSRLSISTGVSTSGRIEALSIGSDQNFDSSVDKSGATRLFTFSNTSNTASSVATFEVETGGATAGDPFILFDVASVQQWSVGVDNSVADDPFTISSAATLGTAATTRLTIDSTGTWAIGNATSIAGVTLTGTFLNTQSASAFEHVMTISNTATASGSDAQLNITVDSTGDSDPKVKFDNGTLQYIMGIDDTDSDNFVISADASLGTNNAIEIDHTSQDVTFPQDVNILGKLSVTGLIDPTGMVFDEQNTVPGGAPGAAKGTLWVRDDVPNTLVFTDDTGSDSVVSTAGVSALFSWKFSTTTTSGDPGAGVFRFNNSTPASVTAIFISETTNGGLNLSEFISSLVNDDELGSLQLDKTTSQFQGKVNGTPTDNGTWWTIPVDNVDVVGVLFGNNKACPFLFFGSGGNGGGDSDYGEIYISSGTTTQVTNATPDTFDKITLFNTAEGFNGISNNTTPDKVNNKITLDTAGVYQVDIAVSFSGSNNIIATIKAFLGGTAQENIQLTNKVNSGGDLVSSSCSGLITATASQDLDIRVAVDGANKDFDLEFSNIRVTRIAD